MWVRIKRIVVFLSGLASVSLGVTAALIPHPEMPAAGFSVALWLGIVAMMGCGLWLIWLALRASNKEIEEIMF